MKFNKEEVYSLLKEPSTYAGIAVLLIAGLGLETFSTEQIAGVLAGIVAILLSEKKF